MIEVLGGIVVSKFLHLVTSCHLCVSLTTVSGKTESLSQYDPTY